MSLFVLEPGIDSRIVDLGRPHSRSLGVPVGGAADRRSLMLGNALLGTPPDAPALEIALKGPILRAEADVGCVLFGAPFELFRNEERMPVGRSFTLHAGEKLRIGGTAIRARAYFCVRGGFDSPVILSSRSSLENVHGGDRLACGTNQVHGRWCPETEPMFLEEPPVIFALPGLQASWFDDAEFYRQEFTVAPASNRMGLRLQGKPLTMPKREMVSEPVCPGSVQVTNDGQCIILGVDGQTIGGYPKIAQVIQADLDPLGQLRPGQTIRFTKISMDEAVQRDRAAHADLRLWMLRLQLSLDAFPAERRFASS